MLWQGCQSVDEAHTVSARLSHTDNSPTADIDAGAADLGERVEPVVHRPRCNNLIIALGRRVDIVVVIIEASVGEHIGLGGRQHAQSHARFHAHGTHALNDLYNRGHVAILWVAPCRPHAETA